MFKDAELYHAADDRLRIIGSESTLASWRSRKMGPPFYKLRGRIFYAGADLNAHVAARRVEPAAAAAA